MKNFNELLEKSLSNIDKDREKAEGLLLNLIQAVNNNPDKVVESASSAAKLVESLQRSNEQLVKLVGLVKKANNDDEDEISEEERDELFEAIHKQKVKIKNG